MCLVAACDAGEKTEPTLAPIPVAPKPVVVDGPNLAYLPADADVVFKIDVARLRKSKLWPLYGQVFERSLVPGKSCEHSLDGASTVMVGMTVKHDASVLVFRGIDQQVLLGCLRQAGDATFDGNFATVKNPNTVDVLTFVDPHTMVVERAKQATRPSLQAHGAPDAALVAALARLPANADIAIASRPGSPDLAEKWSAIGSHLEALTGTIVSADELKLELAMVLRTHDEAERLATQAKAQLKSAMSMFDRVDAIAQDRTVTIDIALGEPKLKSLVAMLGGMISQ
ncbi:MAG: hypothetical protein ABI678_04050 [Kofleriaceae bacterium]